MSSANLTKDFSLCRKSSNGNLDVNIYETLGDIVQLEEKELEMTFLRIIES